MCGGWWMVVTDLGLEAEVGRFQSIPTQSSIRHQIIWLSGIKTDLLVLIYSILIIIIVFFFFKYLIHHNFLLYGMWIQTTYLQCSFSHILGFLIIM